MATKTFKITKQMMSATSGPANPGDFHIPIGYWAAGTGWATRAALYAPMSFSGMTKVKEARLYLRAHAPTSGYHTKGTSTATIHARRKTADWNETSHGSTAAIDEIWGGNGANVVNNNRAETATGDLVNLGALTHATWYYITITGIVQAWFNGAANYGLIIQNATSENSAAYSKEFYSRHAGSSEPYIWISYDTNSAPSSPTSLQPTGSKIVNTGSTITYSGVRSDPDAGDYITAYNIQLFLDNGTTKIGDWTWSTSGTPTTFSRNQGLPSGRETNTWYKWRARTRDKASVWGPWSGLQRFKPNSVPTIPSTSLTQETDTLSPEFRGSFSDPDPNDTISTSRIQVQNSAGTVTYFDSGNVATQEHEWSRQMSGSLPTWGVYYRWRAQVRDSNGAYSSWTAWKTFMVSQPPGPKMVPSGPLPKQTTQTPTILIYGYTFINHELRIYSNSAGTNQVHVDAPATNYASVTSVNVVVSTALNWGSTYYHKARVKLTDGTWSEWSPMFSFYLNAYPSTPSNLEAKNGQFDDAIVASTGTHIVTTTTPILTVKMNDPDVGMYGDKVTERIIEIYNNDTDVLVHTNTASPPSYTGHWQTYEVPAALLTLDTVYKVRWRSRDSVGLQSPWSDMLMFKPTLPSTVASVQPVGSVGSPSFDVTWAFSSPSGKSQGSKRVKMYEEFHQSLDSGGVPDDWFSNSSTADIVVDTVDYIEGSSSLRSTFVSESAGALQTFYRDLSLSLDSTLPIYIWTKVDTLTNLSTMRIRLVGPTTSDWQSYNIKPDVTHEWRESIINLASPVQTSGSPNLNDIIRVEIDIDPGAGNTFDGTVWWDDLRSTEISPTVYDSDWVDDSVQSHRVPAGILTNNKRYLIQVETVDEEGV